MPLVVICNVITENALCIGTIFEHLFVMDTRNIVHLAGMSCLWLIPLPVVSKKRSNTVVRN